MKLKRLFIAPHLLKKKLYNHQSLQKSDGSAEESINSCLKRKQKNLPRHKDKGKITQKQEEKCPLMHWGQTKGF